MWITVFALKVRRRSCGSNIKWKILGLPFYSATFDVPRLSKEHKKSEETIGRQVRYQWLNEIAQSEGYDYISVAHHKDDQAESILAHIIRGSGLNGLNWHVCSTI
ncbi:MAG: ATP-binding protein [Veillonella sp.]